MEKHLATCHKESTYFMCSSRFPQGKQYRIAKALADSDLILHRRVLGGYARRSADIMAPAVRDAGASATSNRVGHMVAILYSGTGPKVVSRSTVENDPQVWKHGEVFLDHSFILFLWRACVINDGNVDAATQWFVGVAQQHGEIASVVSQNREFWISLVEKVFYSAACEDMVQERLR